MAEDDVSFVGTPAHKSYDALWERVDNQGRSIRALAEETTAQFRDLRAETFRGMSELGSAVKGLDAKLDASARAAAEHQRPQYAALFVGMLTAIGVAVTIIQWQTGLHDRPVDDKLASLQAAQADIAKTIATGLADVGRTMVSQSEFQKTLDFQNRISDLKSIQADSSRTRMQAQLDKVDADEVSRREHELHWTGEAQTTNRLEDEIARLNGRLDQLAPASDVIRRLTDREHELELRVFGQKPASGQ